MRAIVPTSLGLSNTIENNIFATYAKKHTPRIDSDGGVYLLLCAEVKLRISSSIHRSSMCSPYHTK